MNRHWATTVAYLQATRSGTGGSLRAWRRFRHHAQEFWGDRTIWPKCWALTHHGRRRHQSEKTLHASGGVFIAQHMTQSAQSASRNLYIFARIGSMHMPLHVPPIVFNWSTGAAPVPRCCRRRGSASSSANVDKTSDNYRPRPPLRLNCG